MIHIVFTANSANKMSITNRKSNINDDNNIKNIASVHNVGKTSTSIAIAIHIVANLVWRLSRIASFFVLPTSLVLLNLEIFQILPG